MQMHIAQIVELSDKDSVLNDTRNGMGPAIELFDSNNIPPEYFKILSKLRLGDSLTIRILSDTLMKRNKGEMPPFVKKGRYFKTTFKLLNIFTSIAQADSARYAEMAILQRKDSIENKLTFAKEDKILQDYFRKNNINVQKAKEGTYVQIIDSGSGPTIDTTTVATVNYTGRTMDGKMFDSNTDSSKGHVEPFQVNMTNDPALGTPVIPGWTDGLRLLKKGSKAKFFIPSPLAYGKTGAGVAIAPNSILIFDIVVINVSSKEKAKAELDKKQKEFEARQKRLSDSLKNVQKMDSIKLKKEKKNTP